MAGPQGRRNVADRHDRSARRAKRKIERADLEAAPAAFAEKRRALISEIEAAEAGRREAADKLAEAENQMAEADRVARASLEALSSAREATARAEERMEGTKRRLQDSSAKSTTSSRSGLRALRRSPKSSRVQNCRWSTRSSRTWKNCGVTASGSAP